MSAMGKYIYGVMSSGTDFRLYRGNNGICAVSYQDISAVVSDSEILDYTNMRKDDLARLLVHHQQAIEGLMSLGNVVIPMRLGTFAQDEEEARDILCKGYALIKAILEKAKEKVELDVVATWSDFAALLKRIGQGKEIQGFKEKALSSPGGITPDDQMKAGLMVKKALDEKKEKYAKTIHDALSRLACECKPHEVMNDTMLMNTAFLIEKPNEASFDEKLRGLNDEFHDELNFRCVGPLPPYSFYTLEVKRLSLKDIALAKEKLGLEEEKFGKKEIEKAYRAKAFSSHPDKNPEAEGPASGFDELVKARKTLLEYDEACAQGRPQGLDKDALLVKLKE